MSKPVDTADSSNDAVPSEYLETMADVEQHEEGEDNDNEEEGELEESSGGELDGSEEDEQSAPLSRDVALKQRKAEVYKQQLSKSKYCRCAKRAAVKLCTSERLVYVPAQQKFVPNPNKGRQFLTCPDRECQFFEWADGKPSAYRTADQATVRVDRAYNATKEMKRGRNREQPYSRRYESENYSLDRDFERRARLDPQFADYFVENDRRMSSLEDVVHTLAASHKNFLEPMVTGVQLESGSVKVRPNVLRKSKPKKLVLEPKAGDQKLNTTEHQQFLVDEVQDEIEKKYAEENKFVKRKRLTHSKNTKDLT